MNDIDNANDIDMILINYCVLALLLYMLTVTVSFQKQIVLLVTLYTLTFPFVPSPQVHLTRCLRCLTLRPIFTFNKISLKMWGGSCRFAAAGQTTSTSGYHARMARRAQRSIFVLRCSLREANELSDVARPSAFDLKSWEGQGARGVQRTSGQQVG